MALFAHTRAAARCFASVALWAAVLGGVFAMHGLSTHGTGTDSAMAAIPNASHADHAMPQGDPAAPDGDHTMLMTACLAILVAVASFVATWLLLRRRVDRGDCVYALPRGFFLRPRMTDPPPLIRLSVMRC